MIFQLDISAINVDSDLSNEKHRLTLMVHAFLICRLYNIGVIGSVMEPVISPTKLE